MSLFCNILHSFIRELQEVARNRLYRAILIVIPLVMILFFTTMFYSGEIVNLPIMVVDKSNSPMSRKLVSMVDATRGVKVVDEAHTIAEAEQLLRRGDVLSIVYINSDFESSILRGEPTKVECYLLGTNISADGVIERDVQQAVMTFSAGVSLSRLQASGVGYDEAMVEIMPINIHSNIVANPYLNYGYYLAPLFMFMGVVILTVVSTVYAFGRELRDATAREWLATSNNSLVAAVIGKMLPITIVMSIMMEFVLFILVVVMGMECAGSYLFLSLSILLFVLAYQSVAIVIISLAANLRLGLSLGGGYAVMAFTFSGITFPVSAMYPAVQPLSKLFPLSYFSDIFIDQMMLGVPISYDVPKVGVLLVFIALIVLVWQRFDRVVRNEMYWRRS